MKPLALLLFAGACAPLAAADPALTPCGADRLQNAIGKPIAELSLPEDRKTRIIRPGDMVTMDYSESRLNIELDEHDLVLRVRCG